jgi:hypothetical protein
MTTQQIVTRDSIQSMLNDTRPNFAMHVIGHALVQLYKRQTSEEQLINDTKEHNSIGFAGCDGKGGTLTAKYYLKHKRLEQWMIDKWTKVSERTGYSRLCKYHTQLNQIAQERIK